MLQLQCQLLKSESVMWRILLRKVSCCVPFAYSGGNHEVSTLELSCKPDHPRGMKVANQLNSSDHCRQAGMEQQGEKTCLVTWQEAYVKIAIACGPTASDIAVCVGSSPRYACIAHPARYLQPSPGWSYSMKLPCTPHGHHPDLQCVSNRFIRGRFHEDSPRVGHTHSHVQHHAA